MNTLEIESILQNLKHFSGVYAADKLPSLVDVINKNYNKRPTCFISNTQPSYHPGEHWVLFYIPYNKRAPVEFFDSFGYHNQASFLHSKFFFDFIEKIKASNTSVQIKTNIDRIQDVGSTLCGHYCIIYAILRLQMNLSMSQILSRMNVSIDNKINDRHVLQGFTRQLVNNRKVEIVKQCCKSLNRCKKDKKKKLYFKK